MKKQILSKNTHHAILTVYLLALFFSFAIQVLAMLIIDVEALSSDAQNTFNAAMNLTAYTLQAVVLLHFFKTYLFKNQWQYFKHHLRFSLYMIMISLYLMFSVLILTQGLFLVFDIDPISPNQAALEQLIQSGSFFNVFSLFIVAVVLAPIVEEMVYRKAIYGLIKNATKPVFAVLGSAFVFAFVHVLIDLSNFVYIVPYFALGLVLSFIYYYSGRLIFIPIFAHALMNLYTFILLIL